MTPFFFAIASLPSRCSLQAIVLMIQSVFNDRLYLKTLLPLISKTSTHSLINHAERSTPHILSQSFGRMSKMRTNFNRR